MRPFGGGDSNKRQLDADAAIWNPEILKYERYHNAAHDCCDLSEQKVMTVASWPGLNRENLFGTPLPYTLPFLRGNISETYPNQEDPVWEL